MTGRNIPVISYLQIIRNYLYYEYNREVNTVIAGYIGIVLVASVLIATNPNNYRSKEEKEDLKDGEEV